jgi:acetoacetate decarboxylase
MGFVKTPAEIARVQEVLSSVEFVGGETLAVDFRTDPEAARAVLPPGLTPAPSARVTATVGRWRSNCVGDFTSASLQMAARHGDVKADYVLAMYMDIDVPLLFGRELFGEPKKLADVRLFRQGGRATATVERGGVRLMEMQAQLGADTGTARATGRTFNVKTMLEPDGSALAADPLLTLTDFDVWVRSQRAGDGTVTLRSTEHDPLAEMPVLEILGARFVESDAQARCRTLARLDAAAYFPFALGRLDDWPALATGEPAGWDADAAW